MNIQYLPITCTCVVSPSFLLCYHIRHPSHNCPPLMLLVGFIRTYKTLDRFYITYLSMHTHLGKETLFLNSHKYTKDNIHNNLFYDD